MPTSSGLSPAPLTVTGFGPKPTWRLLPNVNPRPADPMLTPFDILKMLLELILRPVGHDDENLKINAWPFVAAKLLGIPTVPIAVLGLYALPVTVVTVPPYHVSLKPEPALLISVPIFALSIRMLNAADPVVLLPRARDPKPPPVTHNP